MIRLHPYNEHINQNARKFHCGQWNNYSSSKCTKSSSNTYVTVCVLFLMFLPFTSHGSAWECILLIMICIIQCLPNEANSLLERNDCVASRNFRSFFYKNDDISISGILFWMFSLSLYLLSFANFVVSFIFCRIF